MYLFVLCGTHCIPSGFKLKTNGKHYLVKESSQTFENAKATCENFGPNYHLATIQNLDDFKVIKEIGEDYSDDHFWLGIQNSRSGQSCYHSNCDDQLFWRVGSSTCLFDKSSSHVPQVIFNDGNVCARLRLNGNYISIDDRPCSQDHYFICERVPNEFVSPGMVCIPSQANIPNAKTIIRDLSGMNFQTGCSLRFSSSFLPWPDQTQR